MLRRIGLVLGLFLVFGALIVSTNSVIRSLHPIYNLQTGLTALATYGVILLVNGELVKYLETIGNRERISQKQLRIAIFSFLGAFIGLNLLVAPLMYVILNSEFFEGISVGLIYIFMALAFPVLLPQMWALASSLQNFNLENELITLLVVTYGTPTLWLLLNHRPTQDIVTAYLLVEGIILLIIWKVLRVHSESR